MSLFDFYTMNPNYLDFEQPIAELEVKIEELRSVGDTSDINISEEITKLREKSEKLTSKIYSSLTPWDIVRVARHPQRPYCLDYINRIFDDFDELHGDREFSDDAAIVSGIARLNGISVIVIGQEKGRSVNDKVKRNFGMPRPEGYRKANRIMRMAERFSLPIVTLIDTPGAYPGIDSEERGISAAIAENLSLMSCLRTPILSVVIGEGSSGGALGIGVGDRLAMLQYSTYFVISPEGCANIIWKTSEKAPQAAEAMGLTSSVLEDLGIVDETIPEPSGGAHRDPDLAASRVKDYLTRELKSLIQEDITELLSKRYERLMSYGNK